MPRAERFASRVLRTDGCWLWTGTLLKKRGGYGVFYDDALPGERPKLRRANRVAYELAQGTMLVDPEIKVRHTCDTPRCVRPDHLVLGSQTQNLQDMRDRNRGTPPPAERGTQRYNAKLTDQTVRQARAECADGASFSSLSRKYGVSRSCITRAIKGSGWTHVD